ncbi:MAG: FtsW/RodA/SpoVE family cell cycle protein [Anaerolineae bacterium]
MRSANWREFDIGLFVATLVLLALGVALIYSAYDHAVLGEGAPLSDHLSWTQGWRAGVGLIVLLLVTLVDYHLLFVARRFVYLFILAMLLATLFAGETTFGAQRSMEVAGIAIQPSELAKVLMIVVLAYVLGQGQEHLESVRPFLVSLVLLVPPVILVYEQPDFGTMFIMVATWVGMVFLSGVRWRHILLAAIVGAIAAPVIWFRLEDYMRDRVIHFLDPSSASPDESYNVRQALISIGNGGWWGTGYLQGSQSQLYFLRVRHTDFIFSVLAEELGFLGCVGFLAVYAYMLWRLFAIAQQAPDEGGRLIVSGVAVMLAIQAVINLGANANLLPVTGVPLPLVTYGGSAVLTTLFALGLVQSVAVRRRRVDPDSLDPLTSIGMQRRRR